MLIMILFAAVMAAFLMHEAGHFLGALYFGYVLKFKFTWGALFKIWVPRLIWTMPAALTDCQKRLVALAGFGFEIITIPIFYILVDLRLYPFVVLLHLIVYQFYAGTDNDFKWLEDSFLGISKRGWIWLNALLFCIICWTVIYYAGRTLFRCFV